MRPRAPGLLLVLPLLAGCATQQEDYCATVREHQAELGEILAGDGNARALDALDAYRDLRSEAPADIADEWQQVVDRLAALQQAVEEAGIDPEAYDPQKPPADLAPEDRAALDAAARELGDPATVQAMAGLEQHALDVCKTSLTG